MNAKRIYARRGSGMCENVDLGPARKIERGAGGNKIETSLRYRRPAFALQHDIESLAQTVQMENISGRIGELCCREFRAAPV